MHVSFKDLTGGITDEVALDTPDSGAFDGRLWQRLFSYFKEGYLMGCGNPKPHAGNFQVVSGIVQGHAYAILDLREAGDIKLIQLRNPWSEQLTPAIQALTHTHTCAYSATQRAEFSLCGLLFDASCVLYMCAQGRG